MYFHSKLLNKKSLKKCLKISNNFGNFFPSNKNILNLGKKFWKKNILLLIFDKVLTPSRCVDLKKKSLFGPGSIPNALATAKTGFENGTYYCAVRTLIQNKQQWIFQTIFSS